MNDRPETYATNFRFRWLEKAVQAILMLLEIGRIVARVTFAMLRQEYPIGTLRPSRTGFPHIIGAKSFRQSAFTTGAPNIFYQFAHGGPFH